MHKIRRLRGDLTNMFIKASIIAIFFTILQSNPFQNNKNILKSQCNTNYDQHSFSLEREVSCVLLFSDRKLCPMEHIKQCDFLQVNLVDSSKKQEK